MLLGVVVFAIVIELGQALLPERWPDVTDTLLYCIGAFVGFVGYRSVSLTCANGRGPAD
jgi:VanZ family protein